MTSISKVNFPVEKSARIETTLTPINYIGIIINFVEITKLPLCWVALMKRNLDSPVG